MEFVQQVSKALYNIYIGWPNIETNTDIANFTVRNSKNLSSKQRNKNKKIYFITTQLKAIGPTLTMTGRNV